MLWTNGQETFFSEFCSSAFISLIKVHVLSQKNNLSALMEFFESSSFSLGPSKKNFKISIHHHLCCFCFFASQLSLGCDSFLGIEHKKTGSQILFKKVGLIRFSQLMVCGGTGMCVMAVKYYARFRHSAPYDTAAYNYLFVSYFFY